jgi:hypothetical protein
MRQPNSSRSALSFTRRSATLVGAAVVGVSLLTALPAAAQSSGFSAGFKINEDATPRDTGLNVYPGATVVPRHKHSDHDTASVDFSWGGYGLKVVAVKLQSKDNRESIAKFYRGDLLRFGNVLDCSDAAAVARDKLERESGDGLSISCKSIDAKRNAQVFRVGEKYDQRVVSIQPAKNGEGNTISLVHIQVRKP